jgi:hypothetical protein
VRRSSSLNRETSSPVTSNIYVPLVTSCQNSLDGDWHEPEN